MNSDDFSQASPGKLVTTVEDAMAFVPDPMPTGLSLPPSVGGLLGETRSALGALNHGGAGLANPHLMIQPLQRKEAVLSSKIEGTKTTLVEAFVTAAVPEDESVGDHLEVVNYERALVQGLEATARGRQLNASLLKELHERLMLGVRGQEKKPGEFREEQVFLGTDNIANARFVPPPPTHVLPCIEILQQQMLSAWEDDALIKIAITHYQFECIHPFTDGNGRVGRLLIILQLLNEKVLDAPLLYVSPFLEGRKDEYNRLLYEVSAKGSYLGWIEFFLLAVRQSAKETSDRIHKVESAVSDYTARLGSCQTLKPLQLLELLQSDLVFTIPRAADFLGTGYPTAKNAVDKLVQASIVQKLDFKAESSKRGPRPDLYYCGGLWRIMKGS